MGALFHNARVALLLRQLLINISHPQPPTPITTDNSTAHHFIYDNINQKRSKSWDMRFYWLRDCQNQKQFLIKWAAGKSNLADYFTKHHPIIHHKTVRPLYKLDGEPNPSTLTNSCQLLSARVC